MLWNAFWRSAQQRVQCRAPFAGVDQRAAKQGRALVRQRAFLRQLQQQGVRVRVPQIFR